MQSEPLVYVGTYSEPILFGTGRVLNGKGKGIYAFRLDAAKGALLPAGITEGVRNSSYLAFDQKRAFLYCVNEFKEYEGKPSGAVSAYRIDPAIGALTYLNTKASHGTDPCHLMVDHSGRNALVANFASGSVAVLPLDNDGALKEASCVIQHTGSSVDPQRQAGPHAHAVAIDAGNRYVFVPELGLDKVMIYEFDPEAGTLTPNPNQPSIDVAPGAGPRQLVMHQNGGFAFLINELNSTMTSYAYDTSRGTLAEIQNSIHAAPGFFRPKHLRGGAGASVRKVPLRLQPRPRFDRDLRHRRDARDAHPRRPRTDARQDSAELRHRSKRRIPGRRQPGFR